MDEKVIRDAYEGRQKVLEQLKGNLDLETKEALRGLTHIDRISFRVKGVESFVEKALDPTNDPPYRQPLIEIEDQLAGRVIVFFLSDMDTVEERLNGTFNTVEQKKRRPSRDQEFGYESNHLICVIPHHLKPSGWGAHSDMPATFEIQIRTIFMHAWAEPQHDIGYKGAGDLPSDIRRQMAWIAASAWGADQAFERVWEWQQAEASDSEAN
jgi:ppGpp synthetase/RelA/SpoT-type nucleotidyltranferase